MQLALGEAETSPITKAAETYVALGRSGPSPGCAHCRAVVPDTNPIGLIHKRLDTSSWDMLLRCPQCGAYRWLTYETHGFADAPVGGQATREDIRKYQWYLTFESKKHCTDIGALVEEVFHKCF